MGRGVALYEGKRNNNSWHGGTGVRWGRGGVAVYEGKRNNNSWHGGTGVRWGREGSCCM